MKLCLITIGPGIEGIGIDPGIEEGAPADVLSGCSWGGGRDK